jgi:hypothetical protein
LPAFLDLPRVPPGTWEAGKIAPQANPVNSGVREKMQISSPLRLRIDRAERRSKSAGAINLFCSPSGTRVSFS